MGEEQKPSRRTFLKLAGLGALAGGTFGAITHDSAKPSKAPHASSGKKSMDEVMPPVADTRTLVGRTVAGAAVGAVALPALHRTITGKNPPDTRAQRRREQIAKDREEGRKHEWWQERARQAGAGNGEREPDR